MSHTCTYRRGKHETLKQTCRDKICGFVKWGRQ